MIHVSAVAGALVNHERRLLLGHPNCFYPTSPQQVEDYTVEICRSTDLAVVLFVREHSNLRRLDVRGFPADVPARLAEVDTIVAVKYEDGRQPTVAEAAGLGTVVGDVNSIKTTPGIG